MLMRLAGSWCIDSFTPTAPSVGVHWRSDEAYDRYNVRWWRPGVGETQHEVSGGREGSYMVNQARAGVTYTFKVQGCTTHVLGSSSHKGPAVREMIRAAGARLLYLPPYSPDFNPIEKAFSKLKAALRKAAQRTVDGLWDTIGVLVDTFTPTECANYFTACGYDAD